MRGGRPQRRAAEGSEPDWPSCAPRRFALFVARSSQSQILRRGTVALGIAATFLAGCQTAPRAGTIAPRSGDEIVVAGKFVHTGTPVVLWMDPGGYDAYRVERRFAPLTNSGWDISHEQVADLKSPNRYSLRRTGLSPEEIERVRGGGWDLPTLQKVV